MAESIKVEKHLYLNYLQKADEFLEGMRDELESRRWNMAVVAGVHCAISACDAMTIFYLNVKHKGMRHADAARLLMGIEGIDSKELTEKASQLVSILDFKTPVEYDKTLLREKDARELAKKVERFFGWASGKLPR